jgi:hypothetical protein
MAAAVEDHVEERLGVLESDVRHLRTDVAEIKADARQFRSEVLAQFAKLSDRIDKLCERIDKLTESVADSRTQMVRGDLQNRIWMLVLTGSVLAVIARVFKWI